MSELVGDARRELAEALLAYALGELGAAEACARCEAAAAGASKQSIARLLDRIAVLEGDRGQLFERMHRVNNAFAGVSANVRYLASMLEREKAERPLLEHADAELRGEVLLALRHADEATTKLGAVLRAEVTR
jgi:hypothetical protein